ncbi:MAG: hypothetical protein V4732_15175 [Pseudomonadota bacterium]
MKNNQSNSCACHISSLQQSPSGDINKLTGKKALGTTPSIFISVLIAFFPKCPMCLAAYLSMFGSIGLASTPFSGWLFPVLFAFLILHLFLLLKKSPQTGYIPFLLCLTGVLIILSARMFLPENQWGLKAIGLIFILTSSCWNLIRLFIATYIPSVK